jgi:hypothetical protein
LPTEQLDQPPGGDIDLDAIRLKIDPANERHQHCASLVRRCGRQTA